MDTEVKWSKMWDQLDNSLKPDYLRLNIPLQGSAGAIDAVEVMEEYRNLVILHPGTSRMAREAATALLVSRFFLVLDVLPEDVIKPFLCHGTIRCRGRAGSVIAQLHKLHPEGLTLTTDTERIGWLDERHICSSCGRFRQPVSFITVHSGIEVNIYLKTQSKKPWRISGFPDTISSLGVKQDLQSPFGRLDHGLPTAAFCGTCDRPEKMPRGERRRRSSADSRSKDAKRARIEGRSETSRH